MEQTLGHITHHQNLRTAAADDERIAPAWLPVPFEVAGLARRIPLYGTNWSVRASVRARRGLRPTRAAARYDALFFHTQVTALFSVDLMRRLPTVVSLDATPINFATVGESYGHRAAGRGPLDQQKYRMNRRVFHAATTLITWSEWARRSLVGDYGVDPGRVHVIPPGAAAAFGEIGARRNHQVPEAGRRPRLLFVGGDFTRKGGDLLLECMRGPLGSRCELDIVTQRDVAAPPGVRVHVGLKPNSPELLALFAAADLFVLPSRGECLAVVLMEAAAAGLPIVTTDVGALSEAVIDGESGVLTTPGDLAGLCRALEALIDDPARRGRMGRASYQLAREKLDAYRNGRAVLDLVHQAALTTPAGRAA